MGDTHGWYGMGLWPARSDLRPDLAPAVMLGAKKTVLGLALANRRHVASHRLPLRTLRTNAFIAFSWASMHSTSLSWVRQRSRL